MLQHCTCAAYSTENHLFYLFAINHIIVCVQLKQLHEQFGITLYVEYLFEVETILPGRSPPSRMIKPVYC